MLSEKIVVNNMLLLELLFAFTLLANLSLSIHLTTKNSLNFKKTEKNQIALLEAKELLESSIFAQNNKEEFEFKYQKVLFRIKCKKNDYQAVFFGTEKLAQYLCNAENLAPVPLTSKENFIFTTWMKDAK
jgi:hypothetical protein